jgi:hypothetical protein
MEKLMKFLAVTVAFLCVNFAQAAFLVEPYAGYETSSTDGVNKSTGLREKTSDSGAALGARLGYVLPLGVWFGLDYLYQPTTQVKYSEPTGAPDADGTRSILFLDIGFEPINVPARFFVGYALTNNGTLTQSGTESVLTGNAFKLGAGFKPIDKFAINVEYIQHMYSKAKSGSGSEVEIDDAYDDFKSATVLITLSVPLMF